jgi:nucleoside phosphorylase
MAAEIKTIVALIALKEEFAEFQNVFPFKKDLSTAESVRFEHESGREDVRLISILASQMGAQSALLSANAAVQDYNPDLVVVIGIAGGISSDLQVGDICISNEIIDILQNTKISEKNGKPEIAFAPDFYPVDAELVASFTFFEMHPDLKPSYNEWLQRSKDIANSENLTGHVRRDGPHIVVGPLACGPVVASTQFTEKLQALHRKVAAIETESGGIFGRLRLAKIPVIAIRGISDLADSEKAELEIATGGAARRYAARVAMDLLKCQIANDRFISIAERHRFVQSCGEAQLFPDPSPKQSIVADLETEIRCKLTERSPDFRAKPDNYYLPMPRIRRLGFADDVDPTQDLEAPTEIISCLEAERRIIIRLPRSYPSQALGWSLAYSLIRQTIDQKIVLPYVIAGDALNPPKSDLDFILPEDMIKADRQIYKKVLIIEEPPFHARNRTRFISKEIKKDDYLVIIITKSEDSIAEVDEFVKDNDFKEFQVTPVSFTETAFFLEKSFDMSPHEAESVAIRLDDTFRKFRLEAHPTYFAGIHEETLAALINANKRAELIQLAVDSLLSLVVASDKARPPLSRTTRETFLKRLAIELMDPPFKLEETRLVELASDFISERMFPNSATEFLSPFFEIGLIYRSNGSIFFTHPYLESYLLAQALREAPTSAEKFFNPRNSKFNYYAFDLYCELGPHNSVIDNVTTFAVESVNKATAMYSDEHIYLASTQKLAALSSPRQLQGLTSGLLARAEKMEDNQNNSVRSEKQRLLDAKRYIRTETYNLSVGSTKNVPDDVQSEFDILDDLARSLSIISTAVGAGSESLSGETKKILAALVLRVGHHFSDIWTRNRLRLDFSKMRNDLLSDENIWRMVHEFGADDTQFEAIKIDLQLFIHGFELNAMAEPMGRVLWRVSSAAGVRVLAPVIESLSPQSEIEAIIRSAWTIELDAEKGRESFKRSLADYSGTPLMRIVLASHLLWRVFWHHYKAVGSRHFVNSARRALRPLGMAPAQSRIEGVKKGGEA